MRMPNLKTATAQQIIDHESQRAKNTYPNCTEMRIAYLCERLEMIVGKLVAQRDRLTLGAMK